MPLIPDAEELVKAERMLLQMRPRLDNPSMSVSLRGPIARAAGTSRIAAPRPAARVAREPARAGGEFVLNGRRGANRAGTRHGASEPDQIGMRDNSVGDVDGEIIRRIASASLRHENEVPGTIICRARLRGGGEHDETTGSYCARQELLHRFLQIIVRKAGARARLQSIVGNIGQDACPNFLQMFRACTAAADAWPHVHVMALSDDDHIYGQRRRGILTSC